MTTLETIAYSSGLDHSIIVADDLEVTHVYPENTNIISSLGVQNTEIMDAPADIDQVPLTLSRIAKSARHLGEITVFDDLVRQALGKPARDWGSKALCAGDDQKIFLLEKGHSATQAKKICAGCTVWAPCLAIALRTNDENGVYGGLARRERLTYTRLLKEDPVKAANYLSKKRTELAALIPSRDK
ncbi:MAG: WhiB family transcriptional regulator [Candidatus Saccharimonadales bacterium]